MNLRVYITLLRPVRPLVVIGFVTSMAGLFVHVLGLPADVWATTTAGTVAYYRHRVFTYYRTGDLGFPPSLRSPSMI